MAGYDIDQTAEGLKIGKRSDSKVGFLGATPVAKQTNTAALAITYSANDPSITPNGALTIADGSAPTVLELQEGLEEAFARINTLTTQLQNLGLQASS